MLVQLHSSISKYSFCNDRHQQRFEYTQQLPLTLQKMSYSNENKLVYDFFFTHSKKCVRVDSNNIQRMDCSEPSGDIFIFKGFRKLKLPFLITFRGINHQFQIKN